jgi:hypothetical protein
MDGAFTLAAALAAFRAHPTMEGRNGIENIILVGFTFFLSAIPS